MPWEPEDADRHKKGLTDKGRRQWAAVANEARESCMADGGTEKECDAQAIKVANAATDSEERYANEEEMDAWLAEWSDYALPAKKF